MHGNVRNLDIISLLISMGVGQAGQDGGDDTSRETTETDYIVHKISIWESLKEG